MAKKHNLFFLLAITCFTVSACDGGGTVPDPGYTECHYDLGSSADIASVRVFYPCALETSSQKYDVVTVSGGFSNTQSDMYWLAEHVAENGMVVFALSAANNVSVSGYTNAHEECYDLINSENNNPDSVLFNKVGQIGMMGYSMGGGGVLNASNDLGNALAAVVAMAPYSPDNDLSETTAPTLLIVGEDDSVAPPNNHAEPAYAHLPDISKLLAEMSAFSHLEWVDNTSEESDYPKNLITSWLKYSFAGDANAYDDIMNPPDKFVVYEYNEL